MNKDITFEGIKNALERAATKVENLKHATPQAKKEFNELLEELKRDIIKGESIEIPEFLRREIR